MNTRRTLLSIIVGMLFTAPLSAQDNWARDFLRTYAPAAATTAAAPPPVVAQVFQTGTVPINMQDLIGMMLDFNLDIRSNRLGPRSTYL